MPLALDNVTVLHRPTKKRKILNENDMAKPMETEGQHSQSRTEQDQPHLEAGCEVPVNADQSSVASQTEITTSDRDELIQCIKRGQRPTWVPKPGLKALYAEEQALQEKKNNQFDHDSPVSPRSSRFQFDDELLFGSWNGPDDSVDPLQVIPNASSFEDEDHARSAGSPTESRNSSFLVDETKYNLSTSPTSWHEHPALPVGRAVSGKRPAPILTTHPTRSRQPSLSSSFVMRVPTSPLVNAVNNPNLDFSTKTDIEVSDMTDRNARRRTLPPSSFQSISPTSLETATPNFSRPLPPTPVRRDSGFPFQTHQPRRSIGSFTLQPSPGFQMPPSNARRFSITSESSPKRRTSMIGSFEESILRGRMSSPPSKPFDFVAQIGVMGKGDCPANLKCPPHVSVPFQAVFYSYPSSQNLRSIADDAPSPYVGTIDLEHNLKPVQLATKQRRRATVCVGRDAETQLSDSDPRNPENTSIGKALAREAKLEQQQKQLVQPSSRMDLGGAYRVPQQGQLQIVLKNSNKIAVKLFLVPYDLHDMEPGSKTFIRQRSYSTGPIVEGALSDKSQHPNSFDPLKDKNILRYLIHIKFCCPSKGKFYLYDDIRVVFANRIPDGKEKLRNEVQLPEPRYSPWKAVRTPRQSISSSTVDFTTTDTTSRQGSSPGIFDDLRTMKLRDAGSIPEEAPSNAKSTVPFHSTDNPEASFIPPFGASRQSRTPFVFPDLPVKDGASKQAEQTVSPVQGFFASTSPRSSPIPWSGSSPSSTRAFSPVPVEAGSGLLSRQFRELRSMSTTDDDDEGSEIVMGARAATASLTNILSKSNTPSPNSKAHEST